jgi:hypothetical protein
MIAIPVHGNKMMGKKISSHDNLMSQVPAYFNIFRRMSL